LEGVCATGTGVIGVATKGAGDLLLTGVVPFTIAGDFTGDLLFLSADLSLCLPGEALLLRGEGVIFGAFFGDWDFLLLMGVALIKDFLPSPTLLGVAPFFIGVFGGRYLSKCSGLRFGPNETLFLFALGTYAISADFLFLPMTGVLILVSFRVSSSSITATDFLLKSLMLFLKFFDLG